MEELSRGNKGEAKMLEYLFTVLIWYSNKKIIEYSN